MIAQWLILAAGTCALSVWWALGTEGIRELWALWKRRVR